MTKALEAALARLRAFGLMYLHAENDELSQAGETETSVIISEIIRAYAEKITDEMVDAGHIARVEWLFYHPRGGYYQSNKEYIRFAVLKGLE